MGLLQLYQSWYVLLSLSWFCALSSFGFCTSVSYCRFVLDFQGLKNDFKPDDKHWLLVETLPEISTAETDRSVDPRCCVFFPKVNYRKKNNE